MFFLSKSKNDYLFTQFEWKLYVELTNINTIQRFLSIFSSVIWFTSIWFTKIFYQVDLSEASDKDEIPEESQSQAYPSPIKYLQLG